MEIKEKEFFEYLKCPLRYELLHKGNTLEDTKTFKGLCYEAVNAHINAKANGLKADSYTIKRKWDSIAEANQMILGNKKILDGWGLVYRTYEYIELYGINFTDANTPYKLEFPGTGVCLTGVLNPIIDRGDYIEVFIVSFDRQLPERETIDSKLKHTIDALAIKQMFKKDAVFTYYVPAQNRTIETIRSTKDFERLESIVKMVGKAIDANIIYPRESFMCSACVAKPLCKTWSLPEEVK